MIQYGIIFLNYSVVLVSGNQLTKKLDILEAQQREVLGSLVSDISHLIEEKRKLVDKNKRLSITQDKYHNELQYKIDLLTYENENAAKQFTETVVMFEKEKAKMEADFNASVNIMTTY